MFQIKNSLTHLVPDSQKVFLLKENLGPNYFSQTHAILQKLLGGLIEHWRPHLSNAVFHRNSQGRVHFSNTCWKNPITFFLQLHSLLIIKIYSCFSLQASFILIVWSLYCIPQYFPTNGILVLFATWSFLHCEWYDFIRHLSLFHDKLCIHWTSEYHMPNVISALFTVWNIL